MKVVCVTDIDFHLSLYISQQSWIPRRSKPWRECTSTNTLLEEVLAVPKSTSQGAYTCRRGAAVALSTVRCLHDSHANYKSVWRLAERDVAYITGPEWSLLIYKRKTLAVDWRGRCSHSTVLGVARKVKSSWELEEPRDRFSSDGSLSVFKLFLKISSKWTKLIGIK